MARSRREPIEGVQRLRRALREVQKNATSPEAVRKTAEDIARRVRSNVHIDTGDLQANVSVRSGDRKSRAYLVGWNNPKVGRYSWKNEYGTKYMPANPALTMAVEESAREFRRNVENQVREA